MLYMYMYITQSQERCSLSVSSHEWVALVSLLNEDYTDIDECEVNTTCIGQYRACVNTIGSYECGCIEGYYLNPATNTCTCKFSYILSKMVYHTQLSAKIIKMNVMFHMSTALCEDSNCHPNATCSQYTNYQCQCEYGFTGDGTYCEG